MSQLSIRQVSCWVKTQEAGRRAAYVAGRHYIKWRRLFIQFIYLDVYDIYNFAEAYLNTSKLWPMTSPLQACPAPLRASTCRATRQTERRVCPRLLSQSSQRQVLAVTRRAAERETISRAQAGPSAAASTCRPSAEDVVVALGQPSRLQYTASPPRSTEPVHVLDTGRTRHDQGIGRSSSRRSASASGCAQLCQPKV